MQGVIFTALADIVIEHHGMVVWQQTLDEVKLGSNGAYTRAQQYHDSEIVMLVASLSRRLALEPKVLLKWFGEHLFVKLHGGVPPEMVAQPDLHQFLLAVDQVIHKEVMRLYPNAYLPTFEYEQQQSALVMHYRSKRQLCHVAEGLIQGAANLYQQPIVVSQRRCMHQGHDHCEIVVEYRNG